MHNNGGSSLLSGDLRTSKPAMNKHAAGAHEPVSPNQRGDVEVAQRENQRDAVDFALFRFGDKNNRRPSTFGSSNPLRSLHGTNRRRRMRKTHARDEPPVNLLSLRSGKGKRRR